MQANQKRRQGPRYHWQLVPHGGRFPKSWWHWYRPVAVVAVLVLVIGGILWVPRYAVCGGGLLSTARWSSGGQCVGLSEDAYDFGFGALDPALRRIDQQNKAVRSRHDGCPEGSPVTVGVLVALGSPNAGGRGAHELEGVAAAQGQVNAAGCVHPVRVEIANMGSGEQAATDVADKLKDDADVVAAVGMGVSAPQSASAADLLGRQPGAVPMVADVITAVGFDVTGSRGRDEDFTNCAARYPDGVGGGYFYRVAYDNATQINGLDRYLGATRPEFVLTPTDLSDPYTCTALALVENHFGGRVTPIKFDPTDPSTVPVAVQRICGTSHPVTAFYTARSSDLGRFVQTLNTAYQNGTCQPPSITLLSTSDAGRLLAAEPRPELESIRQAALSSPLFQRGTLKLVYATLTNADAVRGSTQYQQLAQRMSDEGFNPADLDDDWAVNSYDSLFAVAQASQTLNAHQTVTRGQINSAVSALSTVGAGGRLAFDAAGDRIGDATLVRLCPATTGGRPFTAPATATCGLSVSGR